MAKVTVIPKKIKLVCPFAFYDEDNNLHSWQANQEVTDQAEIQILLKANTEYEDLSTEEATA